MFSLKETDRNNLSNKSTGLSKDLASGKKDPREVLRYINSLTPKTPGEKKYLDEIKRQVIFREFANSSIQQQTYRIPPGSKPATDPAFIALKKGETGIPIIDAAVNEMKSTGEPHNRARLLLARYAIRNLNVDPEEVAKWFAESFQDYDPILTTFNVSQAASATNFGEPYYRKSNPLTAQKALDPTGAYVSTWLPADYKGKTKDEIQKEISQGHDY
jgi:deoxyribodipyrimidine photo-lyase